MVFNPTIGMVPETRSVVHEGFSVQIVEVRGSGHPLQPPSMVLFSTELEIPH